jgi:hypothetical protein
VNRFAAAMAMIAAGTSAPMTIAAKATPANQLHSHQMRIAISLIMKSTAGSARWLSSPAWIPQWPFP